MATTSQRLLLGFIAGFLLSIIDHRQLFIGQLLLRDFANDGGHFLRISILVQKRFSFGRKPFDPTISTQNTKFLVVFCPVNVGLPERFGNRLAVVRMYDLDQPVVCKPVVSRNIE